MVRPPSIVANLVGLAYVLSDLYGRGYSDAPLTSYNASLYTTQLAFLMQYLKWDKANIVGLSMGGAIAASFTAEFPHLVDEGVGLVACAGLMEVRHIGFFRTRSWTNGCTQAGDISRTAKFMSSPLVQTLASTKPVQVHTAISPRTPIN